MVTALVHAMHADDAKLAALHADVVAAVKAAAPSLRIGGAMGRVRASWRPGWRYVLVTVRVEQSYGDSLACDARAARSRLERALTAARFIVENNEGDLYVWEQGELAVSGRQDMAA